MALDGPSGSGKTVTALRCAAAFGGKIAVIDTESGSARKYAGEIFDDRPLAFDVLELTAFSPAEYTSAIEEAGRLGYDVLVIDSLSHAWEGKEGALELVDRVGGNRFTAWKDVTPMHRRMVEAILVSPCHVLCTMRSKTEYVLEEQNGKQVPRKIGTAPIQRPGLEYEFDVYGSLDWSHLLTVTKSRCRAVDGLVVAKPGPAFMRPILDWLRRGSPAEVRAPAARVSDAQLAAIAEHVARGVLSREAIVRELPRRYGCQQLHELNADQAEDLLRWLQARAAAANRRRAQASTASAPPSPAAPVLTPPLAAELSSPAIRDDFTADQAQAVVADDQRRPQRQERLAAVRRLRDRLAELSGWDDARLAEEWSKVLARRGVAFARELSEAQLEELQKKLYDRVLQLEMHAALYGGSEREREVPAAEPASKSGLAP
ncbi:MAG TPA: ATP-binding protein [Gemmataceae bacterium]|nr:ATP-binding protein [Gemmataceae bacterium]